MLSGLRTSATRRHCSGGGPVKLKGVIRRFRRDCAAFGLWNTLQAFGIRAIQRVIDVKLLRAMYLTAVAPIFAAGPRGPTSRFLLCGTLAGAGRPPQRY